MSILIIDRVVLLKLRVKGPHPPTCGHLQGGGVNAGRRAAEEGYAGYEGLGAHPLSPASCRLHGPLMYTLCAVREAPPVPLLFPHGLVVVCFPVLC